MKSQPSAMAEKALGVVQEEGHWREWLCLGKEMTCMI